MTGVEAARWLEAQPGWANMPKPDRERAIYLALNEWDEKTNTLTRDSRRELAGRSGYSPDQIKATLTALRRYGLATCEEQFTESKQGGANWQRASLYYLTTDREPRRVSARRQEAARKGLSRVEAPPRIGRLKYTPDDQAHVRKQIRNRTVRNCDHCGDPFLVARPQQQYCCGNHRKTAFRLKTRAKFAAVSGDT